MRLRDFGAAPGRLPAGARNAISDVPGVRVGHTTLIEGEATRTGVTVVLPHAGDCFTQPVTAAVHTINGFGKACGFEQVRELGRIETPIALTNTLNVGRVADALITLTLAQHPVATSINPLVGECNDSFLNDIGARAVTTAHVQAALAAASADVQEGCVGAGTGTACYGFKGGIGTASRLAQGYAVGALLQTNFGRREELMLMGVPVGLHLSQTARPAQRPPDGSVMVVLATDAPLHAAQLARLARRAVFGLARTGTIGHHGSGDFVVVFSTAAPAPLAQPEGLLFDALFQAVVESVEEAVYNALTAAHTLTGRDGHTLYALPHADLTSLLAAWHLK